MRAYVLKVAKWHIKFIEMLLTRRMSVSLVSDNLIYVILKQWIFCFGNTKIYSASAGRVSLLILMVRVMHLLLLLRCHRPSCALRIRNDFKVIWLPVLSTLHSIFIAWIFKSYAIYVSPLYIYKYVSISLSSYIFSTFKKFLSTYYGQLEDVGRNK